MVVHAVGALDAQLPTNFADGGWVALLLNFLLDEAEHLKLPVCKIFWGFERFFCHKVLLVRSAAYHRESKHGKKCAVVQVFSVFLTQKSPLRGTFSGVTSKNEPLPFWRNSGPNAKTVSKGAA